MQTWKLPDPPGSEVKFLRDSDGTEYVRSVDDSGEWWTCDGGRRRGTYHWSDLLYQRGPLTADPSA
jgi:hypothetical protein